MRTFLLSLITLLLTACGTTQVGLQYGSAPTAARIDSAVPVSVGTFVDQRGEPANWIGAIRGGFGNPLKTIETSQPVDKLVESAFAAGLKARGAQIASGPTNVQVSGVVKKLFCNQVVQREASVEVELTVVNASTRQPVFARTYAATNLESAGFSTGVFAAPEDLRALTERTLREVVDKALDDTSFRQALRQ